MDLNDYFETIRERTEEAYDLGEKARNQSKDPEERIDIPVAEDLPEKASSLVIAAMFEELEDQGVAERIRELEDEYGKNDERVSFQIAREIAEGDFYEFDSKERACNAGIRVGVSYMTGGITTAPLEGIGEINIRENDDGSEYLAVYYSGPIRSAGGTASAMSTLLADYVRIGVGLDKFKPSDTVVNRYATEVEDYYNRVTAKQYNPTREETKKIASNVPIEVTGSPTEDLDVSNYKDLDRVETNRIRGGMCLVYLDGLPLKASKIKKRIKKWGDEFGLQHWGWIKDYLELQKEIHSSGDDEDEEGDEESKDQYTPSDKYLGSLTAGRPVFAHPGEKGGFRLRYGHSRTNGLAAVSFHPATMEITERFLAIGTQMKMEYPGKATVGTPCDTIHSPVVRLENGDVLKVETREKAREVEQEVEEILFLGDVLVPYGEFVENGKKLLPSPYVEEWWEKEMNKALEQQDVKLGKDFDGKIPTPEEAFKISDVLDIPLHPRWQCHWKETTPERFKALVREVNNGKIRDSKAKKCLEDILVQHKQDGDQIKVKSEDLKVLKKVLNHKDRLEKSLKEIDDGEGLQELVSDVSGYRHRDQAPHYIGGRMGRPEKAEKRTLNGDPQLLFPCGKEEGGRMRNVSAAYNQTMNGDQGIVEESIIHNRCPECGEITYYSFCRECNVSADEIWFCTDCGKEIDHEPDSCPSCGNERFRRYKQTEIDVKSMLDKSMENLGVNKPPELLKSFRGMTSEHKHVEPIEKGLLREKYDLYVNKDATVRYDASDLPMTHFKPREIDVSVEKLREIGYKQDYKGRELEREDQILELKPQDIIIPDSDKTLSAANYMMKVCDFVDDLLENFYDLPPFYEVEEKEDLVGELVIGLAPHTSGGTVGRIIGFTEAKGIYAHPYWHAGKRRNCLPGGEEVKLADGSSRQLKDIFEKATKNEEADSAGTLEKDIDLRVLSEKEGKIMTSEASKVYKTPAQEFKVKFKTKSGREITVFPDHRVKTAKGVKKARAVEEGDKLITPLETKINPNHVSKIRLTDFLKAEDMVVRDATEILDKFIEDLGGLKNASDKLQMSKKTLSNYRYRKSAPIKILDRLSDKSDKTYRIPDGASVAAKRDSVEIDNAVDIDRHFMKLIGYYLAEGYIRKSESQGEEFYQVCFAFGEKEIKEDMEKCVEEVFGISPSEGDHILTVSSRIVYELLDNLGCGKDAHSKKVPELAKSLPKEKIRPMLAAYFAGDGAVEKGKLHVNATSVSRQLLDDIDLLLKRFGIFARFSTSEREAGGILLDKYGEEHYKSQTFVSHKLHIRSKFAAKFGKEVGFTLDRKQKTLEQDYQRAGKPRIDVEDQVVYDEIQSKTIQESEERFMYDIEVENAHSFVTSENLVTNNCDGDEDAILMMMDGLLNFSRQFLPDMTGARSITKDARLVVRKNGEVRALRADELIDEVLDEEGFETREDGFEVSREFSDDIEAVSFDRESGDVEFADVSALIRHKNDKEVFEVNTSRGEISVTGDHSIFVTEGSEIEVKPVRELEEGDCIIVPSNPKLESEGLAEEIDLFEVLPDDECYVKVPEEELEELGPEIKVEAGDKIKEEYGEHNIYRYRTGRRDAPLEFYKDVGVVPSCKVRLRANTDPVDRFIQNSAELYRLLGYLLSEGDLDRGRITNTNEDVIEDIEHCIRELTNAKPRTHVDDRDGKKKCYWVDTPAVLMQVLKELGLERKKFDEKSVPSFVFGAEEDKLEEFIEAYRAGDGSVYEEKGFSKLYTKSGEMATQLSLLVRKLGFKSSTRQADETWEVLYSKWTDKDPYWPLWNVLDEGREALRDEGADYEEIKQSFANDRKNERMKTASKQRVEELYDKGLNSLEKPVEGDISVERVVEVEKKDYGDDYVYDLEVPGNQNFLCGPHPVFAHNTMDAPLILSTVLNPDEVDDEAWAVETVDEYPLGFYEETQDYKEPWELDNEIQIGEDIVHSDNPFQHGFTHDSSDVENGPVQSEYVTLDEMSDKTSAQLGLGKKTKAVDEDAVAELLLDKHFIPDIKGNLRSFSSQKMRCVDCNEKFRRVPLTNQTIAPSGKETAQCPECGGKVLLTISEGTIKKYMQPSKDIIESYEISPYKRQEIMILNRTIQSLFGKSNHQSGLKQFT